MKYPGVTTLWAQQKPPAITVTVRFDSADIERRIREVIRKGRELYGIRD